ncbi:glycosyltransferase family 39 protein [Mangrovibacterium diazotrophicum]|uniref:Dolichyl-phosphate-mannose-protein mannosyltransferase n=1 Tax=Mangrovibacterium diazotrophicum TaxID=1261403 RepID=A0A419W457_9BACT|nr:glycosyltransferase family 39 protein [Mangrovibacterium diazotrophicum]RKD90225.1 dolichyl-phosphate-mannose-protein mannosyltransferase [Mangrovibacterium diazotrophicum]
MIKSVSKEWVLIGLIAFFKLALHLLTFANYELHRDALLYFSLGQDLEWGYASVPPGIGLIAALTTTVFGSTTFALRVVPALIGSFSVILIGKIVLELKGGTRAILIACLAFVLSPAFLRSNALFQPVSFNQFFWLLSGLLIIRLVRSENPRYWLLIFFAWALAFLVKYSIAFFIVASLLALVLSENRRLLFSGYFFIGGFLAILLISPNLYWQYQHNWPLVHHMSELQRTQFVNVSVTGFLIDQLLMNLPGVFIWVIGFGVFLLIRKEKKYRFLAFTFLLIVIMLLLLHGKAYYTLGFYSILFALGGVALERYFKPGWQLFCLAFALVILLPLLPFSLPMLGMERMAAYSKPTAEFTNRWEDGNVYALPQDYADMTGWKELGELVGKSWAALPDSVKTNTFIFAQNYGQAGAVNFYGAKYGCPRPICFNDEFLLWAPDSVGSKSLLYIDQDRGDIGFLYQNIQLLGEVQNPYFRENGLKLYFCTDPVPEFPSFYAEKVNRLRAVYTRSK